MQTFKHGSFTITCDDAGRFHAKRDGVALESGSLAGMRKKLDAKPPVEPFNAIDPHGCRGKLVTCRVVGIAKRSGRRFSWIDDQWQCEDGRVCKYVYADSPEARAILTEIDAARDRHEAVRKQHEAELQALHVKLAPHRREVPRRGK